MNIQSQSPKLGYTAELRVLADLILKGYEVYGAHRIGNVFDLVIRMPDKFYTVEVKLSPLFKHSPIMRKNNPDILVLVNYLGEIKYLDPLPKEMV